MPSSTPQPETFQPIGVIHSCYREKFAIPRQPGLVPSARAKLELHPPLNTPDALRGIEKFSHLWILFLFHQSKKNPKQTTARPPRLGGNKRVGVFASRSPFRPNPIGLSVVELLKVNGTILELAGGDFLDGTPILDIKPYIPYVDAIPSARAGYFSTPPNAPLRVTLSEKAQTQLDALEKENTRPHLRSLLHEMLAFDPRPAYQAEDPNRIFGTKIYDLEVRWTQKDGVVCIDSLIPFE